MLVECLAPAASGKSLITRKLRKIFNSSVGPITKEKQDNNQKAKIAFAEELSGLKDQVEYYEHRRLMKQFSKRLDFLSWSKNQENQLIFTSMGVLQCLVDLYLRYPQLPSDKQVHNLIEKIPSLGLVISIETEEDLLVNRYIQRAKQLPKEQRLYMKLDFTKIHNYISKQNRIIAICRSSQRVIKRDLHIRNNFGNKKNLFESEYWSNLKKEIRHYENGGTYFPTLYCPPH